MSFCSRRPASPFRGDGRISGETLHLGVVATGGHLLTVIATPDVAAAQVDALVESVGAALA